MSSITISPAVQVGDNKWIVEEVRIDLPDGNYDTAVSGVSGDSKEDAEAKAEAEATERLKALLSRELQPSYRPPRRSP